MSLVDWFKMDKKDFIRDRGGRMNFWNLLPQEVVETNRVSRFTKGIANS